MARSSREVPDDSLCSLDPRLRGPGARPPQIQQPRGALHPRNLDRRTGTGAAAPVFSADGYLQRKISDTGYPPRDWKGIHILLWEEHFGPIPTGHCVCFKDNNKQNVVIDNLELITRAERMRRNSIHRYPPELKSAIRVISKLKRTIQEVEHEEQD